MPSLNMIIKSEWFLVLLFIIMLFRTQIQLIPGHNAGSDPKDQTDDINPAAYTCMFTKPITKIKTCKERDHKCQS